jgi:tetratricopeptide (TPR) repeat protein
LHPENLKASDAVIQTLKALALPEEVLVEERRLAQRWRDEGKKAGAPMLVAEALWDTGAAEEARRAYEPLDECEPEERAHRRHMIASVAMNSGEFEEAIGHFEEVPADSTWHLRSLAMQGYCLGQLDRVVEAREVFLRVQAFVAHDPTWDWPTDEWLQVTETCIRLDAVIAGESEANDPKESAAAGQRALEKNKPSRAFELYLQAFHPDIDAADVPAIEGADAALKALAELDDPSGEQAAHFRGWALTWLRYHFDTLRQQHEIGRLSEHWIEQLRTWETSPTLAPVRSAEELAKLPGDVREAWATLWRDVEAFLQSLDGKR